MAAPLPERIGHYRVTARIGRGAMGVVYAARDEEAGREVAIKIMMADLEDEPDTRTRFLREAQAAGCLVHPNIITIFDTGEEEGRVYIVMELLRGQTLNEYLARPEGVDLDRKIELMTRVCEGLATAHAHGVFHRDVKPGNLFVQHDGSLKILDFGVARLSSSTMTASGYIIGTPDYMSPEQARGREVDQRSDIFSSGAVFYYMVSGRRPFAAPGLPAVLRRVQFEDPSPLSEAEAPSPLAGIIARALAKDPADRYQSMGEMLADLSRCRQLHAEGERCRAQERAERARVAAALRAELDDLRAWFGLERVRHAATAHVGGGDTPSDSEGMRPATPGATEADAGDIDDSSLAAEIERLRAARGAIEAAERALSAGHPREAVPSLEQVARAMPELGRAREILDRCRAAVAELQRREERLRSLVAAARDAATRGDWQEADELAGQALGLDPGSAEAAAIRRASIEAQEREARARQSRFDQYATRATEAIAAGRLDDGADAIDRARAVDASQSAAIAALEASLAAARLKRAAADEQARNAAHAISRAHVAFEAGRREEAIASLEELIGAEPGAPGIAGEIVRLRAEAARIAEQERRRAAARTELERARAAFDRGDFEAAVAAAESALGYEGRLTEATRLIALVRIRQREHAEAARRAARAADGVARARYLIEAGSLSKAAREIARVLDLAPADPAARAVEVQVHRLEAEAKAREEQVRLRRDRVRRAARLVKDARSAFRARRIEDTRALLDRALGLDPDQAAARDLAAELRQFAAAAARDDEDTVSMGAPVDPEDTVSQVPPLGPPQGLTAMARPWGALFGRLRAPRGRGFGH